MAGIATLFALMLGFLVFIQGPRFESIDGKFESIESKFESIESKFESIDSKLDRLISEIQKDRRAMTDRIDFLYQSKADKKSNQK